MCVCVCVCLCASVCLCVSQLHDLESVLAVHAPRLFEALQAHLDAGLDPEAFVPPPPPPRQQPAISVDRGSGGEPLHAGDEASATGAHSGVWSPSPRRRGSPGTSKPRAPAAAAATAASSAHGDGDGSHASRTNGDDGEAGSVATALLALQAAGGDTHSASSATNGSRSVASKSPERTGPNEAVSVTTVALQAWQQRCAQAESRAAELHADLEARSDEVRNCVCVCVSASGYALQLLCSRRLTRGLPSVCPGGDAVCGAGHCAQ